MLKVWIVCEYAGSREHGMNYRPYYLAKEFVKQDIETTIIAASYSHNRIKNPNFDGKFHTQMIDGIKYLWIKSLKYRSSFDKKRVLKWFHFAFKLLFVSKFIKEKPDIVICSTPGLIQAFSSYILAKRLKAKFIFEVRDIWPLSLTELGSISKKHIFIKFLSYIEKLMIKKCDCLVSNLPKYDEYLKDIGINKHFIHISNGIDLDEMNNIQKLDEKIKAQIPQNKFIVGYTGTIGEANGIKYFLQSIEFLNDDCYLVVVGEGKDKKELQEKFNKFKNIIFIDAIPKNQIQSMLELFDVCYIGWKKRKLYKYGISATKIFDYMYAKKPIVHSFSGKGDIINIAKCGISVEAENHKAIAESILSLYKMSKDERELLGKNAKDFVLEHFVYESLAKKYIKVLNDLN